MRLFVPGVPKPQGSKRALVHRSTGRAVVMDSNVKGLAAYRADIREEWKRAQASGEILLDFGGYRMLDVIFWMERPKAHLNARGGIKLSAPVHPATRPDVDKLLRAVLDALTGLAFDDDARVVQVLVAKRYTDFGTPVGTAITIT